MDAPDEGWRPQTRRLRPRIGGSDRDTKGRGKSSVEFEERSGGRRLSWEVRRRLRSFGVLSTPQDDKCF